MKDRILEMLQLQDEMNLVVTATWREEGFAWHRAAMVETFELLDHYNKWKWWKFGESDLPQMKLELVDIWHFMLSDFMTKSGDLDEITTTLSDPHNHDLMTNDLPDLIDIFIGELATKKTFSVEVFYAMLHVVGLSFDELYLQYLGKNTLNRFRQHNGYKDGSYIKTWNGLEDNEVLFEILDGLSKDVSDVAEFVYNALTARYAEI